jgi:hypothetical protein
MLLKVRSPRIVFRLAMVCLALFGVLGFSRVASALDDDWLDGARGALLGATVVLIHLTFRLRRRRDGGIS